MQNGQIEYELKVRQKGRVSFCFDTRLWLYRLHGRLQSEAFRFSNEELHILNDAKSSIPEAVYGKIANILAYHYGVLRAVSGTLKNLEAVQTKSL